MRRIGLIVAAGVLLVLALSSAGLAADRIGVIDLDLIMDESKAGKEANAILAAFVEERQQALIPIEARLEELAHALDNNEKPLDQAERASKESEFDALYEQYVAMVNQYEAEIEDALQSLRNQLLSDIGVVLQMVGDRGGFTLIVDVANVYYYRRTIDLTFEVIREYDELWDAARQQSDESGENEE